MGIPATGEQHVLTFDGANGPVTATVTELASSLRRLRVGDTELVQDYAANALPSQGSGIVLVPWPNRVRDGRWTLDGVQQQLDITEPANGNATHGLLRNTGYRVTDRTESAITVSASVFPQHGYPFRLDTSVRYQLTDDGIAVYHGIHNAGETPAPVGIGVHPYLRVGDVPMRDLVVTVLADTVLEADAKKIPIATHPVEGGPFDLRRGRALRDLELDTAFTDLHLDGGRHRHRLTAPDGRAVELAADPDFGHAQVFTSSIYETDEGKVDAVAIEPMTCAPDALNSGAGLRWLQPDDQWVTSWGITLVQP
jgi:aldose 1-epimerase